MRRSLLVLMGVIALGGCASSFKPTQIQRMRFEPARQAEQRGDYASAFAVYQDAAEDGIVYAQYRVAQMYESGPGHRAGLCAGGALVRRGRGARPSSGAPRAGPDVRAGSGGRAGRRCGPGAVSQIGGRRRAFVQLQGRPVPGAAASAPSPIRSAAAGYYERLPRTAVSTPSWRSPGCTSAARAWPRTRPKPSAGTRPRPRSLTAAAAQGDARAQEELGELYLSGPWRAQGRRAWTGLARVRGRGRPRRRPGASSRGCSPGRRRRPARPGACRRLLRDGGGARQSRRPVRARQAVCRGTGRAAGRRSRARLLRAGRRAGRDQCLRQDRRSLRRRRGARREPCRGEPVVRRGRPPRRPKGCSVSARPTSAAMGSGPTRCAP